MHTYESSNALKGILRDTYCFAAQALKRLCCSRFVVQSYLALLDELDQSMGVVEDAGRYDDAHMVESGCIEGLANLIY